MKRQIVLWYLSRQLDLGRPLPRWVRKSLERDPDLNAMARRVTRLHGDLSQVPEEWSAAELPAVRPRRTRPRHWGKPAAWNFPVRWEGIYRDWRRALAIAILVMTGVSWLSSLMTQLQEAPQGTQTAKAPEEITREQQAVVQALHPRRLLTSYHPFSWKQVLAAMPTDIVMREVTDAIQPRARQIHRRTLIAPGALSISSVLPDGTTCSAIRDRFPIAFERQLQALPRRFLTLASSGLYFACCELPVRTGQKFLAAQPFDAARSPVDHGDQAQP